MCYLYRASVWLYKMHFPIPLMTFREVGHTTWRVRNKGGPPGGRTFLAHKPGSSSAPPNVKNAPDPATELNSKQQLSKRKLIKQQEFINGTAERREIYH